MTAQIKQIVTHRTSRPEVAKQDYALAKQEVRAVLTGGLTWSLEHQGRFRAAMQRQAEARERYLKALGA